MEQDSCHIAVLKDEVVEMLKAKEGGIFLDGTLGGGSHAEGVLEANPSNILYACDRDKRAVDRTAHRLSRFGNRVHIFQSRFSEISLLTGDVRFTGILLDLGTSMDQLRENRGFSFEDSTRLDMRMDESEAGSAWELINRADPHQLFITLKEGGVGREARTVVDAIVSNRPVERTSDLARIINRAVAGKTAHKAINPSTVVFQALRIAVNREYEELKRFLEQAPSLVQPRGRLACISFHSGEDKIVAGTFREWAAGDTAPAHLPVARSREVLGALVNRKPVIASEEEVARNPSSRSARLRVFEFC